MLHFLSQKLMSLRKDENGAVIVMTLGMFLFIYMLCISIYAVGTSIHERMRLQNIADAASYSASVAQADGLSRLALINRAMSWTYIQLTRQQMDYIVHRWLKKTVQTFDQDLKKAKDWNDHWIALLAPLALTEKMDYDEVPKIWGYKYITRCCGDHNVGKEDTGTSLGTCWAGWTPGDNHMIRLGYVSEPAEIANMGNAKPEQKGFPISRENIGKMLLSDEAEKKLEESIKQHKQSLETLNAQSIIICELMKMQMEKCATQVLRNSIPEDELGDYRYKLHLMDMHYPYNSNDPGWVSNLSPYKNTEEDELELLSMTMDTPHLHDVFGDGIDQWFIRGHEKLKSTEKEVWPEKDDYTGEGIMRGYKTANRREVPMQGINGGVLRGNHIAVGNNIINLANELYSLITSNIIDCREMYYPVLYELVTGGYRDTLLALFAFFRTLSLAGDINPSCFNSKEFFSEQCSEIQDNYGLVAEYHWASMRWWCPLKQFYFWFLKRIFPPKWGKYYTLIFIPAHYKINPLSKCSEHGYGNPRESTQSHTRADYKPCAIGLDDVSGIPAPTHDSANDIKGYITTGHTRVYGDDKDIYNENYTGALVQPVKLNEKYFQSANFVALAKKRKNPLSWAAPEDERLDSGNLIDSSLYALFNMLTKGNSTGNADSRWISAVSASRAAYRERSHEERNDSYLSGRVYQTKYSVMSSDQIEHDSTNNEIQPIKLSKKANNGSMSDTITKWPYRFGCPHVKGEENKIETRLKKTWNLCETDWDAVFVPLKFNSGEYTTNFDGLKDSTNVPYRRKSDSANIRIAGALLDGSDWQTFSSSSSDYMDLDILGTKPDDQFSQSYDITWAYKFIQNNIYKKDYN